MIVNKYNTDEDGELIIVITGDHTSPVNYGDHSY